MKILVLIAGAVLLAGCASSTKDISATGAVVSPVQTEPRPPAGYESGVRALDAENYRLAAEEFEHLLVAKPATELDLAVLFNLGAAYEGLGACEKAAERYREVTRSAAGKFPRIQAQALFRLSLAYECLGQDAKVVAALTDARKHVDDLTLTVGRAELPARLAAAYNRLGNRGKAIEEFGRASDGLKEVLAAGSSARVQKDALGKTLFAMGRLNATQRRGDTDAIGFVQSLSMQQPFLLQAVELQVPQWSQRAADDLKAAYANIARLQIKDPARRREFLTRAVQVVNELKRIRMPEPSSMEDDVLVDVDRVERRLAAALASSGETTKLTPEAQRRADPSPSKRK